jgi:hypothetical protein
MRKVICGLVFICLTACGESKPPSAAPMNATVAASVAVLRPTLGVTYAQITKDIETEMLFQKAGFLSDKTPKYFFEAVNGSVTMNLIGQKNDLDRIVYMLPNRYLDTNKALVDLKVLGSGFRIAVPDCGDGCYEWLKNTLNGIGSSMKIVGNKRITHDNLKFAHMIIISHKESPMVIEDNPKQ